MEIYSMQRHKEKEMLGWIITSDEPYQLEFIHDNPKKSSIGKIGDFPQVMASVYLDKDIGIGSGSDPVLTQRAYDTLKDLLPQECQVYKLLYENIYYFLLRPPIFDEECEQIKMSKFLEPLKNIPNIFQRNSRNYKVLVSEEFRQRVLSSKLIGAEFHLEYSDEAQS